VARGKVDQQARPLPSGPANNDVTPAADGSETIPTPPKPADKCKTSSYGPCSGDYCCPAQCCPGDCCPAPCCPGSCCPAPCCPGICCPGTCCPGTCCPAPCCPAPAYASAPLCSPQTPVCIQQPSICGDDCCGDRGCCEPCGGRTRPCGFWVSAEYL